MEDVYSTFLDLILDQDNYKLSLVFDAILGGLSIGQLRTCPSILAFLKTFHFLNIVLL